MQSLTLEPGTSRTRERIDWNSLFLVLLLTVPAALMWVMLVAWPGVTWTAQVPYTAVEVLGSFTMLLLAVFILARYKTEPGTLYASAGLTVMAILEGFLTVGAPSGNQYAWLHTVAGISGAVFFTAAALAHNSRWHLPRIAINVRTVAWWLGGCALLAAAAGVLTTVFPDRLPAVIAGEGFTTTAWLLNALPLALFLFSGVSLFCGYRKSGAQSVLLFTAIVIFLFQASEVFYLARTWSLIWWFWQALRLGVYFSVLCYVLNAYIRTSESLTGEIAERQRAEEDWRNSFNALDDPMLIVNRDYAIVRINEAGLALTGRGRDEVIGARCVTLLHGAARPGKDCPCRRSFRNGKPAITARFDEETGRHYSIKSAPILNGHRRPAESVCLMRDVTREVKAREKEKELQQELNTASRLASIGEVAAGIAHEINNPLTGVIGFSQMLNEMKVPEEMREAVEVIHDGAMRTAGIVQKLLAFARRDRSTRESVDINAVLKGTIDIRAYHLRTGNIAVVQDLADDLPRTLANFGELQQVFLNLVINAEQAMQSTGQGRLTVTSERLNGKARITVTDSGIGVPPENLGKLFDPFFTTKTESGGTGLGLAISYGIIKEHGGTIRVKSRAGEGAAFTIDLPLVESQPQSAIPPAVPARALTAKNGRILVVDDETNICRVLQRVLEQNGHEVDAVTDAATAIQRMQANTYDLVLLDIRMPGMSGIDLYQRMTAVDPDFRDKVVFLTGDIISPRNKSFLEDSGVSFITKPFTGDVLLQRVNLALGGQTTCKSVES